MILKLFAGIEMVARPVTLDIVASEAAVAFGIMFAMPVEFKFKILSILITHLHTG